MASTRIVVLGAGLQGTCVALALAHRGHPVTLIEALQSPLQASSLRNEGKIHLGFVYALDQSGRTQHKMLEGALSFSPLLDRWCGELPWQEWRSDAFHYAVMPDSIATIEELEHSYETLRNKVSDFSQHELCKPSYLGQQLTWLWRRSPESNLAQFNQELNLTGLIQTQELAIDPLQLSTRLGQQLNSHPIIEIRYGVGVEGAERRNGGFRLHLNSNGAAEILDADLVANCTWSDRVRIDATLGIPYDPSTLCYRVKHSIMARQKPNSRPLIPVTMVQGPYGDVVPRRNRQIYISWYPECRTYFGKLPPRQSFEDTQTAQAVAERSLAALQKILPGLRNASIVSSAAGVIVAQGSTDIEDPQSTLHRRDHFGATTYEGWWTVDTGKLTNAPQLGEITAAEMCRAI
ncbi:NAD(P)/FAD-dependent oxidoreductase [Gimesia algae]|uniref:D-amino acid dehydrogenase small subunit n=1 Tax=Gimesia algae TaxID=2527971 RepID=A0A517VBW4_9PLAN|nr:FAD-dependent oxidoreductase [Gimesia algae]QDT90488.1 D-amino acid dehydrogenase small subunit [Gimesia algae]